MGLLGCHVSVEGGVSNAPERGAAIGCEAIQIFTRNQRQWASKPLPPEQIQGFKEALKKFNIQAVMTHSIYLINLASPDAALRRKSEAAFLDEVDRCEALTIPYLVFHPGSGREGPKQAGINTLVESLQHVLTARPECHVAVLIENTAGAGAILGSQFEEIAEIRDRVGMPARVKICFDTAHAFAAGYDLRTPTAFAETLDRFNSQVGLEHLKAFHINDSFSALGSNRDRHENIGKGRIGRDAFRYLVNDRRFERHPMTLETPGGDEALRRNLRLLFGFRLKQE
jgi:deoxyribonuclease-4